MSARDRIGRTAAVASLLTATLVAAASAQDAAPRIPLVTGLVLGSVLHSPLGEREDVLEVRSADATGVHYPWHERMISAAGDTTDGFRRRFVSANDLAGAPRFDGVFGQDEKIRPGFTALSLSSAVYRQLRASLKGASARPVNRFSISSPARTRQRRCPTSRIRRSPW